MQTIKIAYIGGGSRQWARVFMNDLALAGGISGEIALYDISREAAERNRMIGERINESKETVSKWHYTVANSLETALKGADFVVISILPGTFTEMRSDVHAPEKYGIWQSVGDTSGPGGVLRSMRTVPLYEEYARAIRDNCPNAWVINFTNPMSICVKTLYDVFPAIKAFGCCHEVFHTQEFLACVVKEMLGVPKPERTEVWTDVSGINHFTWITAARWKDTDVMALLPAFIEKYFDTGYYEYGSADQYKTDMFAYGNRVKMDMFNRYGALGAAGDRHLVEFMDRSWYLANPETANFWKFALTTVDFRVNQMKERVEETLAYSEGRKTFEVKKSTEEAVELIKAIMGFGSRVSNVNFPNRGQIQGFPAHSIVETNCVFSAGTVTPVTATPLPNGPATLVLRNLMNIEELYAGIKERNLDRIFSSFINQPLCSGLSIADAHTLFDEMTRNTAAYLPSFKISSK